MFQTEQGPIKIITYLGIVNDEKLLLVRYVHAPNPERQGWWIPAPELRYGEDPLTLVRDHAKELGISVDAVALSRVESFATPGGWHLILHFRIETRSLHVRGVRESRWVTLQALQGMTDLAHGAWEASTGARFLASAKLPR